MSRPSNMIWSILSIMFTKTCITTLTGHTDSVLCLLQLRNGDLVSGSLDKNYKNMEY